MIKSILGGKSKNLCDLAHLLTLPVDKTFQNYGFWRVLINAEPNTTYTFSRENANQITGSAITYLAISAYDDISHNYWLNHPDIPGMCNKSATLTTGSEGKLWILFNETGYTNYWQKDLNPFGYIQLELGSTATEYVPHELTSYKSIMKVSDVCQLVDKSKFPDTLTKNGITLTNNTDGSLTLNGTPETGSYSQFLCNINTVVGHKYALIGIEGGMESSSLYLYRLRIFNLNPSDFGNPNITTATSNICSMYIQVMPNITVNNLNCKPQLFDLTEMFGAGNEPKTVAEFKAKFPNEYYPYSPSCFVTSFDERMPCKTKNLINSQQIYQISQHMDVTIWQGEVNYVCTFSYELSMLEPNTGMAALFEFAYSDGTYSYIIARDKYRVLSQITDSKKLTKIRLINWSDIKGIISNIQLEKGSTATDYVPYGYV